MRILVVEDEPNLNQVLVKSLKSEGFAVDSCSDGKEALDYLKIGKYDVILLDIMLKRVSGLEVLEKLRADKDDTSVLILTALDSIEDRVKGLDLGADDYLVKPFAFSELMARIRALTRRNTGNTTNSYEVGDLTVNADTRTVTRAGKNIVLSNKEFGILEYMIRNKGVVLSRDKIEQNAWDFSFDGGSNVVDVYIRYLRKKIDDDFDVKLIHTIRGAGYVLRGE